MFEECIIGYRVMLKREENSWRGIHSSNPWKRGVNRATCQAMYWPMREEEDRCTISPTPNCTCGIYAYHHIPQALNYLPMNAVVVAVRGYGRVCLHHSVWRSQYAEVIAVLSDKDIELEGRAGRAFGVPVLPLDKLTQYIGEFGRHYYKNHIPPEPMEIRPWKNWGVMRTYKEIIILEIMIKKLDGKQGWRSDLKPSLLQQINKTQARTGLVLDDQRAEGLIFQLMNARAFLAKELFNTIWRTTKSSRLKMIYWRSYYLVSLFGGKGSRRDRGIPRKR